MPGKRENRRPNSRPVPTFAIRPSLQYTVVVNSFDYFFFGREITVT